MVIQADIGGLDEVDSHAERFEQGAVDKADRRVKRNDALFGQHHILRKTVDF